MLTIALSLIAYLFTGYAIGQIDNREYFDNTPTKELGLFRRTKRLLLFPFSYHNWSNRVAGHSINPTLRGISESHRLGAKETASERYCKIATFLWPFKLASIVIGTIEIVYFGTVRTIGSIFLVPSQGAKYLGTGIKSLEIIKRRILPASFNPFSYINDIGSCLRDIEAQRNPLLKQKENLEREIRELSETLNTWQDLLTKSKPTDQDRAQIVEVTEAVAKEMDQRRRKITDLTETINTLSDREQQLKDHVTKLAQCKKMMNLGIPIVSASGEGLIKDDAIAILTRTTVSSAQSYIAECRALLEKA
ncbi:MAG: hypothetical protein A3C61_03100 [Candidatus Yanofskybacteria bacterium RIFCSPHIGHO2_02_FULL_39_10]|uniref:Uncharacterized protein n=1 Tax=Candidatus Yanofskybacteria bacterium RIFCSPHIGHO2_02_FULL_39_10 TaxID=1802674 RepID=A0A1F8F426_9BACT|nr:MAG: hypothetical protein A3C61_03100 [Candidatus Yanofskybacteria bacterium RIFCSPHIGHO2_02_FULL_39_10]